VRRQPVRAPVCVAVHAVFAPCAYWNLLEAGAAQLATANTILHASNAIDVSGAVAAECRALLSAGAARARPARRARRPTATSRDRAVPGP
jgi:ribose-phosphate pyrophosphokinase